MKKLSIILLALAGVMLWSCTTEKQEISLTSLVAEMTERTAIAEYPTPYFSVKQFSSYDQRSIAPDQEGWFANHDASWFIRQEENNGRREFVMLDADGPGAIVRFWMTFGNQDAYTGTIRFYFDGNEVPEIEGPVLDVISGGMLVGEPLSSSVSPETNYYQRGHNLYLPIPYASHLKITYECPALNPEKHSPSVYYNINYRTWEAGTEVISFTMDELQALNDQLTLIQTTLSDAGNDATLSTSSLTSYQESGTIEPENKLSMNLSGRSAIHRIHLKINAEKIEQALRSTVIEINFDGEKTVWSPVGDFFGTGYQIRPYKTWYTRVDEEGNLYCYWIMPFKSSAELSIINYGEQQVTVEAFNVATDRYKWTKNSMHFGAIWHELYEVESGGSSGVNGDDKHVDVNYVTLTGQGVYVGTGLTVFNTADAWWGEGDEKIWVDGETFPSFIGTGTEDYFGYAWCRPEKFDHFLIAQPDGSGNFHPGMSVNLRFNLLDVIPFTSSLQFDLELWHWAKTIMNYAPISYWYLKPGGSYNIETNPEGVKNPVSLKMSDMFEPKAVENGVLEGEDLRVLNTTNGNYQTQISREWGWSNDRQLWWIADQDGAELTADFIMPEGGTYQVSMIYTKASDYGNFEIVFNDQAFAKTIVGYHDKTGKDVITQSIKLGDFHLVEGINSIKLKVKGQHPKALPRFMVGIDKIEFSKN